MNSSSSVAYLLNVLATIHSLLAILRRLLQIQNYQLEEEPYAHASQLSILLIREDCPLGIVDSSIKATVERGLYLGTSCRGQNQIDAFCGLHAVDAVL